jgi:GH18 family chitinase
MKTMNTKVLIVFLFFITGSFTASAQFKVVGYLPTWSGNVSDIQFTKLTHINYAFLLPTTSGGYQTIENGSKLTSLVSSAHANGVKVIISVGGGGGGDAFKTIITTAALRTTFVNNMVKFANQYNLDGVDVDWEFPSSSQANNFYLMMNELATAMHNLGKLCTIAVIAQDDGGSISSNLFQVLDFINIMDYDDNNFQHSTYASAVSSINYWKGRGLAKEKTILGVPFYGRDNRVDYGTKNYNEILAAGGSAYADTWTNYGYNGIPTIKSKTSLALAQTGGMMMWELSGDTKDATSLVSAIDEVIKASANPDNLALNKAVTVSSEPQPENPASALVDGNPDTRWSASVFPQWFEIDLGSVYDISKTEAVCYSDRAYQYKVEVKTTSAGTYTQIIDRTANTVPGTVTAPITDNFASVSARYVKVTVTGCSGYTGTWASISEFSVFRTPLTNLSLNKIVTASSEPQPENPASAAVDGSTDTRWSASVFPQSIEVDLGSVCSISKTEIVGYSDRAYQFRIERKSNVTDSYIQVVDRTANTTPGTVAAPISDSFGTVDARYVRLTVTGCSGYTGTWASISEFRVFGLASANASLLKSEPTAKVGNLLSYQDFQLKASPNPVNEKTTISYYLPKASTVKLTICSMTGQVETLLNENQEAGAHDYVLDASRLSGNPYVVTLLSGGSAKTVIISVVK